MSNIKELCKDISFDRISNWMNITQKKLDNAKLNLGINNDEIILFYDSSLLESGKVGLAICEGGIYWKDSFSSPRYLSWDAFRKTKLTYDKNNIYFGGNGSVFVYETEVEKLVNALNNIRISVKAENFVEKTAGFFGFVKGAIDFINELDSGNNSVDNRSNEQIMLNSGQNEVYNNEVIDVDYSIESNKVNYEESIQEIENVKDVLAYLSKDLIGDFVNVQINNDEELGMHIVEVVISAITLTGDEKLLILLDEDTKQTILKLKETLDPQLELVENTLNSDIMNEIGCDKISLKKAINLYNHRVKVAIEEYENQDEEDIEEIYDDIQIAVKEFRKTLKKMIKCCNLFIEKIYIEA